MAEKRQITEEVGVAKKLKMPSNENEPHGCCCNLETATPCGYDIFCVNRVLTMECLSCHAGERCQNQKFQKRQYAFVHPFWTINKGFGLLSLESITKGHFIIEYAGEILATEECQQRALQKIVRGDSVRYCKIDDTRYIDGSKNGNYSRFINHSLTPNCEIQKWYVKGSVRVGVFALTDVAPRTELTMDYRKHFLFSGQ